MKPSISSGATLDPPAGPSLADRAAQSKIDNEGWEERLAAKEQITARVMAKVDAALAADDPDRGTLSAEQKKNYRDAFIGVTDNMNNEALARLEDHLNDVKFYDSAQTLTDKVLGPGRLDPGSVCMGAWAGRRTSPEGTLHLDGGDGHASDKHSKYAAQQIYAHEIAHAIDWIPARVSKEPTYKLKVSADEAEKTILARIDALPISDRLKQTSKADVLWNLGEPHAFNALGVRTDDLYRVTGHREIHHAGRDISSTAKWISAHSTEINTLDSAGKPIYPLSKYATTSASEGFAEFGRLVFTAPKQARVMYPKCWAIWAEHGLVGPPKKASAE